MKFSILINYFYFICVVVRKDSTKCIPLFLDSKTPAQKFGESKEVMWGAGLHVKALEAMYDGENSKEALDEATKTTDWEISISNHTSQK
ncbi:hypothetical protein [Bacillus sp. C1]